jgi:hypothetical protein
MAVKKQAKNDCLFINDFLNIKIFLEIVRKEEN